MPISLRGLGEQEWVEFEGRIFYKRRNFRVQTIRMKNFLSIIPMMLLCAFSYGQNTVGLTYADANVSDGYTLFTPPSSQKVCLIDNCGRVIKQWQFFENAGLTAYLLENGNVLYAGRDSLAIHDWDDNHVWSYATTDNGILQHHDIEPLPNGNILCVASSTRTGAELTQEGRNPALIGSNFKTDGVIEIEPIGTNDANVVWEWYFWDHIIQDFDGTKNNFGVVADHPELINLNYDHGDNTDWNHVNGIDYNAVLDQIIISSRNHDELYIIDHSTTANEAASHAGGNAGKGGDFLWRWGNPEVYGQGTSAERRLDGPHDAKWVTPGYLHDGKVTVFNNGGDGVVLASEVIMLDPTFLNGEYAATGNQFDPQLPFQIWSGDSLQEALFSAKKSGAHALENGGYMICESRGGRFVEVNEQLEVVWMYTNPITSAGAQNQNYTFSNFENESFRAEKYPINYAGFAGKLFDQPQILEDVNTLSDGCTTTADIISESSTQISIVNPVEKGQFEIINANPETQFQLIDLSGKLHASWQGSSASLSISSGVYLLKWTSQTEMGTFRILVK